MFALRFSFLNRVSRSAHHLTSFPVGRQQIRRLSLHEYQSKALMNQYGVKTQNWRLATTPEEAAKAVEELKTDEYVVKAQIHAGGRGKGVFSNGFKSGVHVTKDAKAVPEIAKNMLGNRLITKQTPPEGVPVHKLTVAESVEIKKETYFAVLMDRSSQGPILVGSPKGGMDIEKVAEETPDQIFKERVDITRGVDIEQCLRLTSKLGFSTPALAQEAATQVMRLYDLFVRTDATQIEVNPLAETNRGVFAIDAKINIDDNAAFRQQKLFDERDTTEDDPREVAAAQHGLNYVAMDGNIGCMVNGAGLAMATMDIIQAFRGKPANFLDVGGGASVQQVTEAFKILSGDPRVKAILVNIFGGIMKCDVIAQGIIQAAKALQLQLPLVVRLEGTNVELGKQLLLESGLKVTTAVDLNDAARKAVEAIGIDPGPGPSVDAAFERAAQHRAQAQKTPVKEAEKPLPKPAPAPKPAEAKKKTPGSATTPPSPPPAVAKKRRGRPPVRN